MFAHRASKRRDLDELKRLVANNETFKRQESAFRASSIATPSVSVETSRPAAAARRSR